MIKAALNALATRFPVAILPALLAAGCGGGGGGGGDGLSGGSPFPYPITAEAPTKGMWSPLFDWPIIPIHVVLMPDGRVVNYGTDQKDPVDPNPANPNANPTTSFVYDVWSPSIGTGAASHVTLKNPTGTDNGDPNNRNAGAVDFFCSAQVLLPEPTTAGVGPSVLVVGGDTYPRTPGLPDTDNNDGNPNSVLIDDESLLSKGNDMNRGRWYATVTTLLNGDIYIQGGKGKTHPNGVDHPEIRLAADKTFHLLDSITTGNPTTTSTDPVVITQHQEGDDTGSYRYYYPRNFVVPGGSTGARIFGYDTLGRMYFIDPYANTGRGSISTYGLYPQLANEYQGDESTAAMIGPGRVLQVGARGGGAGKSAIIDIRSGTPAVTATGDFSKVRKHATSTILPTGQVVITGGSVKYNERADVSKEAETWNPVTGTWTLGAAETHERLYHSTALLMADGSVLIGGGGGPGPLLDATLPFNATTNPQVNNFDANIYYPPYLFTTGASGAQLASRPGIGSISADPQVRRDFTITFSNAPTGIARVTLVKTGSVTHNFNMDQRFIELSFDTTSATQLAVRMPSTAAEVPPGYYLLFVIDGAGVPSVGKTVFVNTAPAAQPAQDPSITSPGNRTNTHGVAITNFTLTGSDPNGAVTFAAGNLPPGITITSAGAVSGTPTTAGSYDVAISVSDGTRTATTNFVWTVN